MMTAEIQGLDTLVMKFTGMGERAAPSFESTMAQQLGLLEEKVRERMASLFHNPARMQESVSSQMESGDNFIDGQVKASGLPYLAIQEYGGRTRPHEIFPVNATVLAFMAPAKLGFSGVSESGMVFAKHVNHPGSNIPERSYMRSALAMRRAAIIAAFQRTAEAVAAGKATAEA
jgi:hypothetical protein